MQNGALKDWLDSSFGWKTRAYIEDIYEDYLNTIRPPSMEVGGDFRLTAKADITEQPHSQTRDYFRRLAKDSTRYHTSVSDPAMDSKQVKVLQLINAFRFRGHQNANLDPLGLWKQEPVPIWTRRSTI